MQTQDPRSAWDAGRGVPRWFLSSPSPRYRSDVPIEFRETPLGRARIARSGTDVTVVTYGSATPMCLGVADHLISEGSDAEVIDLRTLYPWDVETVTSSVERTGRVIVVHEAIR